MKTYLVYLDKNDNEVDNAISHYKTLNGLIRYGKPWITHKYATRIKVYSFNNSSQLYSDNMKLLGTINL